MARRIAAGGLVVLAGVSAIRSDPAGDRADVLVAARDLGSGTALTASDVRLEKRSAATSRPTTCSCPVGRNGSSTTSTG